MHIMFLLKKANPAHQVRLNKRLKRHRVGDSRIQCFFLKPYVCSCLSSAVVETPRLVD